MSQTPRPVIGGSFTVVADRAARGVAVLDPATDTWLPLGEGLDGNVTDLTVRSNGELLAVGTFSTPGTTNGTGLARFDGTNWLPLPGAPSCAYSVQTVTELANGDLVVGYRSHVPGTTSYLQRWDGSAWSELGGVSPNNGVFGSELLANGDLVVAGWFNNVGGVPMAHVARWDGTSWSPMGAGLNGGLETLTVLANGDVVVGGGFSASGTQAMYGVARFDGNSWQPFGGGTPSAVVRAARELSNGDLVVAGSFLTIDGVPARGIARWDGTAWHAFGNGADPQLRTLLALPSGGLLVGGDSHYVDTVLARGVARWNGTSWSGYGDGVDDEVTFVQSLPSGRVVVAGRFTRVHGSDANRIALSDQGVLQPLGSGIDGSVYAAAELANGDIVVGGLFTIAGSASANVARWDGTAWHPMANGLLAVRGLAVDRNDQLLASAGSNIWHWTGSAWTTIANAYPAGPLFTLGDGLVLPQGVLVTPIGGRAVWNGSQWTRFVPHVQWIATRAGRTFCVSSSQFGELVGKQFVPLQSMPATAVGPMAALPDGSLVVATRIPTSNPFDYDYSLQRCMPGGPWRAYGPTFDEEIVGIGSDGRDHLVLGGRFRTVDDRVHSYHVAMATPCAATTTVAGAGCSSAAGTGALVEQSPAFLGGTFRARCDGIANQTLAIAVTGTQPASLPLQTALPIAAAGCTVHVVPVLAEPLVPIAGAVTTQLALPHRPALVGQTFVQQVVLLRFDSTGAPNAAGVSDALAATIGSW